LRARKAFPTVAGDLESTGGSIDIILVGIDSRGFWNPNIWISAIFVNF
jgi:hypothetical protein